MTPTYLIINADGDEAKILAASGLYLFGFTYLCAGWDLGVIASDAFAILLAVFGVVIFGALFVGMRQRTTASTSRPATEPRPA